VGEPQGDFQVSRMERLYIEELEMPARERIRTNHEGVFFYQRNKHPGVTYYILYKKSGVQVEEKAGHSEDGMTLEKAIRLREAKINLAIPTNQERRDMERGTNKWTERLQAVKARAEQSPNTVPELRGTSECFNRYAASTSQLSLPLSQVAELEREKAKLLVVIQEKETIITNLQTLVEQEQQRHNSLISLLRRVRDRFAEVVYAHE